MHKIQKDRRRVGLLVDPYSMTMHSRLKKKDGQIISESENEKLTEHLSKLVATLVVIVISSFSFGFTMSSARKHTQKELASPVEVFVRVKLKPENGGFTPDTLLYSPFK